MAGRTVSSNGKVCVLLDSDPDESFEESLYNLQKITVDTRAPERSCEGRACLSPLYIRLRRSNLCIRRRRGVSFGARVLIGHVDIGRGSIRINN